MNLAHRVLEALRESFVNISDEARAEVRLAALLHDIGHSVFSHGSEFFYRTLPEFRDVLVDAELKCGSPSESECLNYCIITSEPFQKMLWEPIKERCLADEECRKTCSYLEDISLTRVAQMIIGAPPDDLAAKRFLAEIVNGPLDVDKLDYLSRDSYFTGVNLAVDIDRLLPSLRVASHSNPERKGRVEKRLVVDQRGIAVVEQLLFARMLLYDTVYHHHKVRAANATLQAIFRAHHSKPLWRTSSKKLSSAADFLEIDENDFLGAPYTDLGLKKDIATLRTRELLERALVLTPRVLVDKQSHTKWSLTSSDITDREDAVAQRKANDFLQKLRRRILFLAKGAGAEKLKADDVIVDIPSPPRIGALGHGTLIKLVDGYCVPLSELFPFHKVVNNYSIQYKYRSYVFAPAKWASHVAYAAFRAFDEEGIHLNDLALILAHREKGTTRDLLMKNHVRIPDWRTDYYIPDAAAD